MEAILLKAGYRGPVYCAGQGLCDSWAWTSSTLKDFEQYFHLVLKSETVELKTVLSGF